MTTATELLNAILDTLDGVEKRQKDNYIADGKTYHLAERCTTQMIRDLILLDADRLNVERKEHNDIFQDPKIVAS